MRIRDLGGLGAVCVVLGVLMGLAVTASAQGPGGGPMGPRGPQGPPPGAGGGLPPSSCGSSFTDQQRTQIKALVGEEREARRAELDERRTLHLQLTTAIYGTTTTDAETVAQIAALLERQHAAFVELLDGLGVEVEVAPALEGLLDAVYMHDPLIMSCARRHPAARWPSPSAGANPATPLEELQRLGTRVGTLDGDAFADGGDRFWLDDTTAAIGLSYRTNVAGARGARRPSPEPKA